MKTYQIQDYPEREIYSRSFSPFSGGILLSLDFIRFFYFFIFDFAEFNMNEMPLVDRFIFKSIEFMKQHFFMGYFMNHIVVLSNKSSEVKND